MKDMLDVRPIAGAASKSGCDALESLPILVRPLSKFYRTLPENRSTSVAWVVADKMASDRVRRAYRDPDAEQRTNNKESRKCWGD
jgi:hypothetical protein